MLHAHAIFVCNLLPVRLKTQAFIYTFVGMETNDHESINLYCISGRNEPTIILMFATMKEDRLLLIQFLF